MDFIERKREWIHKPIFSGGPASFAQKYFREILSEFRNEHKEFGEFLFEIGKLLKAENKDDFKNIEKFIDNEAEVNWIAPNNSLFDVFIKLFNLCLSPKQALLYINECLIRYKTMMDVDFHLDLNEEPTFIIGISNRNGKVCKMIRFIVEPKLDEANLEYHFEIATSLDVVEDRKNDVTSHVDDFSLKCQDEKTNDALMLFEYHQDRGLLRKVFDAGIKELESKNIIRETNQRHSGIWTIHHYEANIEIG